MQTSATSPPSARLKRARTGVAVIEAWPLRRWVVAFMVAVLSATVIGVPTGIVGTSFYTRMTPVTWWDYPVWAISAVLVGLTAATYVRIGGAAWAGPDRSRRTLAATALSTLAVGCPICNKLVLALVGVSGALSYWALPQPVLGVLSIALLLTGLALQLCAPGACPTHPQATRRATAQSEEHR